jgi:hypothetical protein
MTQSQSNCSSRRQQRSPASSLWNYQSPEGIRRSSLRPATGADLICNVGSWIPTHQSHIETAIREARHGRCSTIWMCLMLLEEGRGGVCEGAVKRARCNRVGKYLNVPCEGNMRRQGASRIPERKGCVACLMQIALSNGARDDGRKEPDSTVSRCDSARSTAYVWRGSNGFKCSG